jgi:hypothetical protein
MVRLNPSQFTVECRVRDIRGYGLGVLAGIKYCNAIHGKDGLVYVESDGVIGNNKERVRKTGEEAELPMEQWCHVAAVRDGNEQRLYINGKFVLRTESDLTLFQNDDASKPFRIGNAYTGDIDWVRVSNTARYLEDFKPAFSKSTDNKTLALYHFDEGKGEVLKDSSGNNHHGKITGAKWVRVDKASSVGAPDREPGDPPTSEP